MNYIHFIYNIIHRHENLIKINELANVINVLKSKTSTLSKYIQQMQDFGRLFLYKYLS